MINKVLIANRGEIACRIIESVQAAGYDAVAIHSDADADALFTALADELVSLGGSTAAESYLDMDKVIQAAIASGSDAIHPGYGFLSENAQFADRCFQAGITFIGPSAEAIEIMGNKAAAKKLMLSTDVPCIPGYQDAAQDNETLIQAAAVIGYPVMVKAAAGGGGRGIRLVESADKFVEALQSARAEASSAFGSDELILEKAVVDARHIEIQIIADSQGNVVHLFERDCSAQRRHQKVIEEAPSPFMTDKLREAMGEAAVNAAKAVGYVGAGTVEFLVDQDRNFYFLEMNTRLQVEHPVTEMITGVDLVDWQLQIAAGGRLPVEQQDVEMQGHSIEVRIYAEDPTNGFMPQTGELRLFEPDDGEGVRIDHGVYSGAVVSPYYDAMLAKVIAWGQTREEARRRLVRALKKTQVLGLTTNKTFLVQLLSEPNFIKGDATTSFIDDALLSRLNTGITTLDYALASTVIQDNNNPLAGWSNAEPMLRSETYRTGIDGSCQQTFCRQTDTGFEVSVNDESIELMNVAFYQNQLTYTFNGVTRSACFAVWDDQVSIDIGDKVINLTRTTYHPVLSEDDTANGYINASTEGLVIDVLVNVGDTVKKGDALVLVEAMKMEHRHIADADGVVKNISVAKGQQVKNRQLLIELTFDEHNIDLSQPASAETTS
ncbi:MAG: acetyl-CoA carboxylase biotin carboxylase subunit [Pseudomonadales bacterium]|nr:acetyl-CoA carboxylase biotin carboxylase subunit [Pseudomonadales bacterium]MDG1442197.1 acetyl-CoA carboxylase biotin carboxylase subunit [Pseudomonadales bacterium]